MSTVQVQNINHTNGTSATTIASSGIITNGQPVGFCAGGTATQTISNATYTKANLTTTHALGFDTQSGWSDANDYYTVPAGMGGYWLLTAQANWTRSVNFEMCLITTNGDDVTDGSYWLTRGLNGESGDTTNDVSTMASGVFNLSAGDKIAAVFYHTYGSNLDVSNNSTHLRCFLSGWRLF